MALAYIFFGAPGASLVYYGYVSYWDVTYTHFAQNMVPMRAVVDVSFTLLPLPTSSAAVTATKAAGATAAGQNGGTASFGALTNNVKKQAGSNSGTKKKGSGGGTGNGGIIGIIENLF